MTIVRFGCRLETGVADYAVTASQAQLAERLGYDSVWVRDHVALPETTGVTECLECFTTLAGLARDTERVKLGTLVVCNPWRNPALVAKMGATIDVMSGGRLMLGLGAGAPRLDREFARYGWPDGTSNADRARAVGEAIQLIRMMWTEPAPSFSGRYYRIDEAICDPKPLTRPHPPLIIGGGGEQIALRNVVRYADGWNSTLTPDLYAHKVEVVNRYCEEEGRDPASIMRLVNQIIIIDEPARARERLERAVAAKPTLSALRQRTVAGTAEMVAERVHEFLDLGADTIITYMWEADIEAQRDTMAAFAEGVMPRFRNK